MTLSLVRDILIARVLTDPAGLDQEVLSACASDFMSDVLAYVKNQGMLLTGLVNPQVIRTADMMDMKCVCFVRGKNPDESLLALARDRDITVMSCPVRMYDACGLLYTAGLNGEGEL